MYVDVINLCGSDTISRDSGAKIRKHILDNWKSNEKIILDFKNKLIGSVSFFDEAIALLIKKGGKNIDEIKIKIELKNINPDDKDLLNYITISRMKEDDTQKKLNPVEKILRAFKAK